MNVKLERLNKACHFKALNEGGQSIEMDGSPEVGGEDKGMRPMEILLASLGGCSSIDVVEILKKQRQELKDIKLEISAKRQQNVVPALFEEISVHFILYGNLEDIKVKKALDLSMEKYCSVAKILEPTAKIIYDYKIIT